MNKVQIRQGDILLEQVDSLPEGLEEKDKVIALGEVTGHSHRFESSDAKVFKSASGQQYAQLESPCDLVHEEHHVLTIPKGLWRVINAREFDLVEGVRQVMD